MQELAIAVMVLAALSVAFLVVLAVERTRLGWSERRRAQLEARLRPLALALIDEGRMPRALPSPAAAELAVILGRYGGRVRGDARERIAAFFEGSGTVDEQLKLLGQRRDWVRADAASALGDMGSARAVAPLLEALADPSRDVRSAAAYSLGRLRALDAVEPLLAAVQERRIPRAVVCSALLEIGAEAVPRLLGVVADPEPVERATAVELVGLLGDAADGRRLVESLIDTSAEVRANAARALGRLGAEEAAAAVRQLLADRIPFVRVAAAEALGLLRDDEAVEGLLAQARRDSFDPARAAAEALGRIAPARVAAEARHPEQAGPHVLETADLLAL
jgi:HEAT repeat protein